MVEAEISLADAEKPIELGRTGIGSEINQIGNGGLLDADAIVLKVVSQIECQIGSSFEVVFPTEMVGSVFFLKPVGRLSLDFRIESSKAEVLA